MGQKFKRCSLCTVHKPVKEFYKRTASPDGLQGYCRSCNTLKVREHYLANAEELKRRYREEKWPKYKNGPLYPQRLELFKERQRHARAEAARRRRS